MSDAQNARNRQAGRKEPSRPSFLVEDGRRISQTELIRSVQKGIRHFENSPRRRAQNTKQEAGQ
jgi:hypothetical protein